WGFFIEWLQPEQSDLDFNPLVCCAGIALEILADALCRLFNAVLKRSPDGFHLQTTLHQV
ncbi:MAG: hypothetical protein KI786_19400, partial [Mameliella sp.]|nr:hypothetical protein [Phaeodactylibacter sp.]